MEPVRVTFVSSHAQLGGSEKVLGDLLAGLEPEWIADIVSLQQGPAVEHLRAHGRVEVLHTTGSVTSVLRSSRRLRARVRDVQPEVIHANGVKAAVISVLAFPRGRPPIVWFKQDTTLDGFVGRAIARRCALVVGVSHAVLEGIGDVDRRIVVHPGIAPITVDRNSARDSLAEMTGFERDDRFVALVGRLHPSKGHHELIAAAPTISESVPDARFVFVGGDDPSHPDYPSELRAAIEEAGLSRTTSILGHVDSAVEVIAGCDLVAVPSVTEGRGTGPEGFGLVALEAMSVGTPVVAYGHGALPEVLDGAGEFVPPGQRAALADAIVRLLTDPARRAELIEAGATRVKDFPPEGVSSAFRSIYERYASA